MALDVKNIVNVNNNIENQPVQGRTFGKGLILTTGDSQTIDRVRTYSSIEQVLEDFGSNTEVYQMASTYFANGYYGQPAFLYVGIYDSVNDASIEDALVAISDTQLDFYVFLPDTNFDDTQRQAISAWIEASSTPYIVLFNDFNPDTINTGIATDLASLLKLANPLRSGVQYESATKTALDYYVCAIAGQMATVDFTATRSAITFTNKSYSSVIGEDLSNYQFTSAKNCGTYTQIKSKGIALSYNGVMSDGKAIDVVQSTDYIKERITNAVLDEIRNRGKIPYTQTGLDIIESVLVRVSNEFVASGIVGGGVDFQTGELLASGFKITVPTITQISPTDKANRVLNNVRCRYLLAGAIETINIDNFFQL